MSRKTLQSIKNVIDQGIKLTPMMEQFYSIKQKNPDIYLFFRMGDFYELFFNDAEDVSKILNITLTHRGKIGDVKIPMAGIPHHAASSYIDRLTTQGLKVAICEQTQDPKDAIGIVTRDVTQIVSPGMPYDLDKVDFLDHHYMASASYENKKFTLVVIDFTNGSFFGQVFSNIEDLLKNLRKVSPREFITYPEQWIKYPSFENYLEHSEVLITQISKDYFVAKNTNLYIEKLIPYYKKDTTIVSNKEVLSPLGALSYYMSSTQDLESLVHLRPFKMILEKGSLQISMPTLTGLEILPRNREFYKESLIGLFNKTKTSMGSRKLKELFTHPISNFNELRKRHDLIAYFLENLENLENIRELLNDIRDLERIMAKASSKKINAQDLTNTSKSIEIYFKLAEVLKDLPLDWFVWPSKKNENSLLKLSKLINKSINDETGASLDKGNLIQEGFSKDRDILAHMDEDIQIKLTKMEKKYREQTGILKLRIKSNNIFGYFIEIPKAQSKKVSDSFTRRQTLVNCERYTTKELIKYENKVIASKEKLERIEKELFAGVVDEVKAIAGEILLLAEFLSYLDAFQGLSWISHQENLVRPKISKNKKILNIKGGWHPLVKSVILDQFVTHDLQMDKDCYFGLVTGPNMAGKTTVMREMAIIQFLAQIGCFVPAKSAHLGLCDYLFSRLGASDDILKGQSTFMVEMSETSEIIRHATERSLIILDEVGRGTSTFDGLSIAWSLVEYFIRNLKSLTLFATHYHELIDLVENEPGSKNLTVETITKKGDVQFLYRLVEKATAQSYGIYVAKLAGLPQSILNRSQEILGSLEKENLGGKIGPCAPGSGTQLSFFGEDERPCPIPVHLKEIEGELTKINIMNLTPLQALEKLNNLKESIPLQ
ncbi:MAG: DNA mismatch repair protein MutS [Epsilonproteobacteria bacterium]|nr:MAG: DNA mismatch repair protein MutS [Campylobacterota bacterium]RLA66906.1 MAG: DNA mismatch repair protein MutS [Campylobacterota bacterium]